MPLSTRQVQRSAVSAAPLESFSYFSLDSVLKGTGAQGLRANANRRRSKREIRDAKLEEERRAAEVVEKFAELERL